uniref:Uncharacterized protein MANES_16G001100 n=1 Tax=Rhizophora mucronata TaxID=61149 RepID=A0A2P2IYM9_RHIMU
MFFSFCMSVNNAQNPPITSHSCPGSLFLTAHLWIDLPLNLSRHRETSSPNLNLRCFHSDLVVLPDSLP